MYEEVTRELDIGRGDGCLVPSRQAVYQNPIETWCEDAKFLEKYGREDAKRICSWAKAKAPLDPRKDEPLPDWVVDVLRLGRIGYKGRIRIVMTHAEDILKYRIMKNRNEEK